MNAKIDLRLRLRENEIDPTMQGVYRHAFWVLGFLAVGLRFLGMKRCYQILKLLTAFSIKRTAQAESVAHARQLSYVVRVAARRCPFQAECLEQSMTLWYLLKQRGIASQLRLGSRFGGAGFAAHAWIELEGQVVSETVDPRFRYVPFDWSLTAPKPARRDTARRDTAR